jgi:hypothetical protein
MVRPSIGRGKSSAHHHRDSIRLSGLDRGLERVLKLSALVDLARNGMPPTSRSGQASWRSAQAALHLARGASEAAYSAAREAARILRATDLLSLRADVYTDLSHAVGACGDLDQAKAHCRPGPRLVPTQRKHRRD